LVSPCLSHKSGVFVKIRIEVWVEDGVKSECITVTVMIKNYCERSKFDKVLPVFLK